MKKKLGYLSILFVLILPPVVQAVAPTLEWSRTLNGTRPSGDTLFTGQYTGGACAQPENAARIDWVTGTVWVAYTDGQVPEISAKNRRGCNQTIRRKRRYDMDGFHTNHI